MKKFFSFLSKLTAFITFSGVILYCVGYFFASKARRVNELFKKKDSDSE
ncbi:MAG: hypothetical protein II996_05885 [Oscillospiraceae bacterium]|nr:hypothetical protein [Oscillospiraceae bacterium]MBQ4545079.1 hypothetical protein [Oscillospiraceae bacterium]MBQ6901450.1 hypothetical protein [Oscillospiraceae bacterium]